jgi:hypothetical protein
VAFVGDGLPSHESCAMMPFTLIGKVDRPCDPRVDDKFIVGFGLLVSPLPEITLC